MVLRYTSIDLDHAIIEKNLLSEIVAYINNKYADTQMNTFIDMTGSSWIQVEYSQLLIVSLSILVLESSELCLKRVTVFLQELLGGKGYRRVVEIRNKIRELENEKKEYHSVDQFPKIAKIERKIIQLELEEKEISLSYYITYGIPILLPIIYRVFTYCIYISLIITYRQTPIFSSEHLLLLPRVILILLALPTWTEGGIGCVYVILTARMIFSHLLNRVVIRKYRKQV